MSSPLSYLNANCNDKQVSAEAISMGAITEPHSWWIGDHEISGNDAECVGIIFGTPNVEFFIPCLEADGMTLRNRSHSGTG